MMTGGCCLKRRIPSRKGCGKAGKGGWSCGRFGRWNCYCRRFHRWIGARMHQRLSCWLICYVSRGRREGGVGCATFVRGLSAIESTCEFHGHKCWNHGWGVVLLIGRCFNLERQLVPQNTNDCNRHKAMHVVRPTFDIKPDETGVCRSYPTRVRLLGFRRFSQQ